MYVIAQNKALRAITNKRNIVNETRSYVRDLISGKLEFSVFIHAIAEPNII